MNKNIIISVESRKGGVGKTTAALCLSKNLLEEGYAVLLIDTDITGTNISDCADSPFWKKCLNILTIAKNNEVLNANLLSLFEDNFMNGNKIPSFQGKNIKDSFNIDLKKINILGSQIYAPDGKTTTICSPAVLFDQLHGYWFVDFLNELIEDFTATTNNKPIAVVLDNSPGYVGIAPAIQDWLTDLGPEIGKFLLVTSLDSQDMQSCAMAISVLHERYEEKWNTSREFLKAKGGNGENIDYSLMMGNFFVKLTAYEESFDKKSNQFHVPFAFYNDPQKPGNEYLEFPEKYLGVIVNRVPKTVFKHRRTYRPELHRNTSPFLNLLGGHYSREWSKRMIEYDPYIEYQFLQSGMSTRRSKGKWSNKLYKLLMPKKDMFYDKKFLSITEVTSPEAFHNMNNYISQFQDIIDDAIGAMRANDLDYLADLIDDDWQPKHIVANLQATFYNLMTNADHPFFKEMYWEDFEDERTVEKKGLYRFDKIMHLLDIPLKNGIEYQELRSTIFYLIASLPIPFERTMRLQKEFLDFFRTIIKIEMSLFEGTENKYYDLPRILSSKLKSKMSINEIYHKFEFLGRFIHRAENELFDFFHAFTSAQARLMRLPEDSSFLLWLIQTMVEFENEKPNTLPYVKKIAEDVILHKTLSYNEVKEKSSSVLSEAQYFVDFDKALKGIVKCWGL
ncbi:MAG: AAA family ATPase [Desulfobacula sp.]|jgi:hypothetical protein